jgi:hypothetical protein
MRLSLLPCGGCYPLNPPTTPAAALRSHPLHTLSWTPPPHTHTPNTNTDTHLVFQHRHGCRQRVVGHDEAGVPLRRQRAWWGAAGHVVILHTWREGQPDGHLSCAQRRVCAGRHTRGADARLVERTGGCWRERSACAAASSSSLNQGQSSPSSTAASRASSPTPTAAPSIVGGAVCAVRGACCSRQRCQLMGEVLHTGCTVVAVRANGSSGHSHGLANSTSSARSDAT